MNHCIPSLTTASGTIWNSVHRKIHIGFTEMEHSEVNDTDELHSNYTVNSTDSDDYIYDRTNIRVIFFSLHTIVFCLCFFGKYTVHVTHLTIEHLTTV